MNRSLPFYTEVLGFKKVSDAEFHGEETERLYGLFGINTRVVRLQLGEEFIDLTDFLTPGGRDIPGDQKSNDLIFQHIAIVVSDMDKAYERLRKYHVEHVSTVPQTLPVTIPEAAGIKAFYFHDPDNHNLELIWFPKGKGQDKWQRRNGKIFMGIDHTAIGISNTGDSHRFYSDLIGFDRKGESWNKGMEQAHLNNVEMASLHITGYRAKAGPGVEFLQYVNPGPGKLYPVDSRPDDLWHWQTILVVNDLRGLSKKLEELKVPFVSKGIVQSKNTSTLQLIIRDGDGHALLLKESRDD
jgi:catechol 2,3-dioxygenase-like lactoylglutathione lyase family enzyme